MYNSTINKIIAREILDSRGNPTIEVDLELDNMSLRENMNLLNYGTMIV